MAVLLKPRELSSHWYSRDGAPAHRVPKKDGLGDRATNITDNVSIGPGIAFNAKGQNDKVKDGAFQNRGGKLIMLAPKEAVNGKPEWPLPSYQSRG